MGTRLRILTGTMLLLGCGALAQNKADGRKVAVPGTSAQTIPGRTDFVSDEFVIGPADVLSILVWKEPELSGKAAVRPDGRISLPLIGEIQASGLTAMQLQSTIQEKLKSFLAAPTVSVVVSEIKSQMVFLMGEVGRPGPFPLSAPMRVLELLARAGGVRDMAKKSKIQIVRREGDKTLQLRFNYDEFMAGRNLDQNIYLKAGDVIIVP